jgi:hypothetical protein
VLTHLLEGLRSSPLLQAATLDGLFATVPAGANGEPATGSLMEPLHASPPTTAAAVLASGRHSLAVLESVLAGAQSAAPALLGAWSDALLLSESSGLERAVRTSYAGAAAGELTTLGASLKLGGSRAVTLTSRTGRIPVTILSSFPYPLQVKLRLYSTQVEVPGAAIPLTVAHTRPTYVQISTRTSGLFSLRVQLSSPVGGYVLLDTKYSVTSTAVSLEAILLSAGAGLVLAVWWLRSALRHRRAKLARRSAPAEPSPVGQA